MAIILFTPSFYISFWPPPFFSRFFQLLGKRRKIGNHNHAPSLSPSLISYLAGNLSSILFYLKIMQPVLAFMHCCKAKKERSSECLCATPGLIGRFWSAMSNLAVSSKVLTIESHSHFLWELKINEFLGVCHSQNRALAQQAKTTAGCR